MIQFLDERALVQIPKHDRSISTSADKALAIWSYTKAVDGSGVEGKVVSDLQGVSVPD